MDEIDWSKTRRITRLLPAQPAAGAGTPADDATVVTPSPVPVPPAQPAAHQVAMPQLAAPQRPTPQLAAPQLPTPLLPTPQLPTPQRPSTQMPSPQQRMSRQPVAFAPHGPVPPRAAFAPGRPGGFPPPPPGGFGVPAPAPRPRRGWIPIVSVLVVLLLAGGCVGLYMLLRSQSPDSVVTAAVQDAGRWSGVHYKGRARTADGTFLDVDVTTTGREVSGTVTRVGGAARAQIVGDATGVYVKAERNWWTLSGGSSSDAAKLADTWLADDGSAGPDLRALAELGPAQLGTLPQDGWFQTGERVVDGTPCLEYVNGTVRVLVSRDAPQHLVQVSITRGKVTTSEPISVTPTTPAETDRARTAVRVALAGKPAPKVAERRAARATLSANVTPEPLCTTPSCTATITVTNTGTIPAAGTLYVSADGTIVTTRPVTLPAGQRTTFTAVATNRLYSSPGARGTIDWEVRAILS